MGGGGRDAEYLLASWRTRAEYHYVRLKLRGFSAHRPREREMREREMRETEKGLYAYLHTFQDFKVCAFFKDVFLPMQSFENVSY